MLDTATNRGVSEKTFCNIWFSSPHPIKQFQCGYNAEFLGAITTVKRLLSYVMAPFLGGKSHYLTLD